MLPAVEEGGSLLFSVGSVVGHWLRSDTRLVKVVEKGLARFSNQIGFRPDFEMRGLVNDPDIVHLGRVNVFWKVMRLRNGVAKRIKPQ